jgi:hypothetical protein
MPQGKQNLTRVNSTDPSSPTTPSKSPYKPSMPFKLVRNKKDNLILVQFLSPIFWQSMLCLEFLIQFEERLQWSRESKGLVNVEWFRRFLINEKLLTRNFSSLTTGNDNDNKTISQMISLDYNVIPFLQRAQKIAKKRMKIKDNCVNGSQWAAIGVGGRLWENKRIRKYEGKNYRISFKNSWMPWWKMQGRLLSDC